MFRISVISVRRRFRSIQYRTESRGLDGCQIHGTVVTVPCNQKIGNFKKYGETEKHDEVGDSRNPPESIVLFAELREGSWGDQRFRQSGQSLSRAWFAMRNLPESDRSAILWYGAERLLAKPHSNPANTQSQPAVASGAAQEITIEVWLFGLLSALTTERPVKLTLSAAANTLDVLTAMDERYGAELFMQIRDAERGILPCCRVFVDGAPLEDAFTPIAIGGSSAMVEMILIKAFEGG